MCIDYRGLNNVTKEEYYPLPNISDLIQGYNSGSGSLFSIIDVAEAYHQIDMEEKYIPLTGFSTFQGHYEYLEMPFGLVNAPSTFQRFMNITLAGLTGELCLVYLDDIIIFNSAGIEDHIEKLRQVFEGLREANVVLKPKKCSFLLKKVKSRKDRSNTVVFYAKECWRSGIIPRIPNAAVLISPLTNLTKKDVKFELPPTVLEAIQQLKDTLTSEMVLIFADFTEPFIVATDAPGSGVGDNLSAIPKIGCGIDGLVWEKVQEMIEFIFHYSNIELCVYEDTKIVATKTSQEEGGILMEPEWDRATLKLAQDKDIFCQEIIKLVKEEDAREAFYYLSKDGILYRVENDGDKLIVPKTFIPKVMEDFHDSPIAGHPGQQKTIMSLKRRFFWPNMRTDVIKYCTSCDACNRRKTSPHMKKAPLQRFTPTTEPWELTSMDVVGPLVTSLNGNRYLLKFQDYFTKYVEAIPLPNQKANTIARAFVQNVIVRHGSPKRLHTDIGANFTSSLFKEVCKYWGSKNYRRLVMLPRQMGRLKECTEFSRICYHTTSARTKEIGITGYPLY
ncbi:hypothetical protein JTB14_014315 [Gonioctena quinquepunctata]|nr:hypothetical protein JTB14_014315 [Gonioctena quinquepunctata]